MGMHEDTPITFAKHHLSAVVGVIDIAHSTEILYSLSGDKVDEFSTIFLREVAKILWSHDAVIIKDMGDGMLFYFPNTRTENPDSFRAAIECSRALIDGREAINQKLTAEGLPQISYRVSMSFGPMSAMLDEKGVISDLFGATVSSCSKINKIAGDNGVVIGEAMNEHIEKLGIPTQKIKDYRTSSGVTFGVFGVGL